MKIWLRALALLALMVGGVCGAGAQTVVSVLPGWNQLGNGYHTQVNVPATLGDATRVYSVWKWVPSRSTWAFYSPQQADKGAAYAASRGFDALTTIGAGEGFWVNAAQGFNFNLPDGAPVATGSYKNSGVLALSAGWNDVTVGYAKTPGGFNNALSETTPIPGVIAQSFQSLWAWDGVAAKWYFYAPSLDAQGGDVLANYISANGYLSFATAGKVLDGKTGFFVTQSTNAIVPPPSPPIAQQLTGLQLSGATALDEGTSATYQLTASYADGTSAVVNAALTLDATSYASVTGAVVSAAPVSADQSVKLNAGYTDAGVTKAATLSITVKNVMQSQSISFGTSPSVTVGSTGSVSATGGASGTAVTFSSTTPTICTVSGSTVTAVVAGTCTVAANQAGNANYSAAAQATQNITVSAATQTITFGAPPTVAVGGTGTVSATGGASGTAVTFSSTTPAICTVSGSTVTAVVAGTCTVAANQAGNANYSAAAQATQNMTVGQGNQSISFGAAPSLIVGGTGTVSVTGGASGTAVIFSSTTPAVCTLAGSTVTGVSAGTCVIAANQTGNANYSAAAQVTQNVSVGAGTQSINFGAAPSLIVGSNGVVSATGGASGNLVTFSSTTPTICTVSGSTVSAVAAGTCTVAANQTGNANYSAAAQVTQNVTVSPAALVSVQFVPGWNLIGNSVNAPLDVAATFGNANNVLTVWKWIRDVATLASDSKWAFFTPNSGAIADNGAAYAASKGYVPLSSIGAGDGFWVNAKAPFTAQLPAGPSVLSSDFQDQVTPPNKLPAGWSLIATGDDKTPSDFNKAISATSPVQGAIPLNITTLWAWGSEEKQWYFYAPSLEASGGLIGYNRGKGYLDFGVKTLSPTTGFWVNKP